MALIAGALFFYANQGFAQDVMRPAPEVATGFSDVKSARGKDFMVVSAHPLATKIGYDILQKGGSAADAGIAVQLALGLVEPQSSGLGGGAFALYYDAAGNKLYSYDARETAPASVGGHLFTGEDGKPLGFYEAAIGGRSVGVPGVPRLLEILHKDFGKMGWRELFNQPIALADNGFTVTPRLEKLLRAERGRWHADVKTKLVFYPDSSNPLQAGEVYRNKDYAQTLRLMAQQGADVIYKGDMASKMIALLRENRASVGSMTIEDLAGYQVKKRDPVCGDYRGYKVCSVGEPSSGGLTLLQILGMAEHFSMRKMGPENPASWHVMAEASRLAFADRNLYMADPDFVRTPGAALIDPSYLYQRQAMIDTMQALKKAHPGTPPGWQSALASYNQPIEKGTTHISIVDREGNILSMTSSIENAFGSRLMVGGFLLNNQLTDFSFVPEVKGKKVANQVAGGKRPRSSMTPVIVFDPSGRPFMVIGSAGGSAIIGYVAQRIIAAIDWGYDPAKALSMPNIIHRGYALEVENTDLINAALMKPYGHPVQVKELNSGLTMIERMGDYWIGAADPRREGLALGE